MHHRMTVRVGAVTVVGAIAALLAGCVAPSPAPSPSITPSVTATPGASPTAPATPPATAEPTEVPDPGPEPEPDPKPTGDPDPTAEPGGAVSLELLNSGFDPATGSVSVAAMVVDRVSDAGTCTLTVSQGSESATASAPGRADANVTYCADLTVALPAGATGTWTVTVDYSETGYTGSTSGEVVAG